VLLNKIYNYQTLEYFQNIRNGSVQDLIIYGLPFALLFSVISNLFSVLIFFIIICLMIYVKNTIWTALNLMMKNQEKIELIL
jgi:hypothetical protein